jgi:hypothetical protein
VEALYPLAATSFSLPGAHRRSYACLDGSWLPIVSLGLKTHGITARIDAQLRHGNGLAER